MRQLRPGLPAPRSAHGGSSRAGPGRAGARRGRLPLGAAGGGGAHLPRAAGRAQADAAFRDSAPGSLGWGRAAKAGNRPPPGEPPCYHPAVPPLPPPPAVTPCGPPRLAAPHRGVFPPRGFPARCLRLAAGGRPAPLAEGGAPSPGAAAGGAGLGPGGVPRPEERPSASPRRFARSWLSVLSGSEAPAPPRGSLVSAGPASGPMPPRQCPSAV